MVIPLTADNFAQESENYRWYIFTILNSVVGNAQEAEDLTQDVFVRAWKQVAGPRPVIEQPQAWLRRIALNAAIDVLRRREVVKILPEALIEANDEYTAFMEQQVQSGDMTDRLSDREQLEYILSRLPPKERETFLLHFYHGLKHQEIADLLDLSISTIHDRMQHARAHAQQLAHEFDHPDESGSAQMQ